ncbi:FAD synthase (RibF) [Fructobacillus evanidus]|uniref:Riboflavin biosynthesis protein n=2 Tax=Fructobacillus evanidus TaxID=3064281 RepID=A0ABM9ML84_9LACO|nr:FAD synthase (RibF) [Fructobacillus sp. LMG 32999]CAK1222631.1 FAD synthase (RibF) [Fructobacillus sp. LMG 32999]CAK1223742.1 FAD synthase (RibF) [Fructobacillus sp. LMG 32999]CAK1223814.1 FAD synthase (RibF) [Fructobacillus sp. LMG 32999]CAK1223950.1 FAD synthase (RibF) [Fructobacillus sp. LMG 32999]
MPMTELISLHYPLKELPQLTSKQVLAMGFFDGVHLGHQKVIQEAARVAHENGLPLAVLTYSPYPGLVFKKLSQPWHDLTPLDQKVQLLGKLGVDRVYCLQLTSHLSALHPEEFIKEILLPLQVHTVVAGFDHRYGKKEYQADMAHLPEYAAGRFDVLTVAKKTLGKSAAKVASRQIRQDLAAGDLTAVTESLGRVHETTGLIVHGDARGRTLGFPTINIWTPEVEFLPGIGVYAVSAYVDGRWVDGMASIGRNVTFEANRPVTVEINLFDFADEVYGEPVKVQWYAKLRNEVKFDSAEALVDQLLIDQQKTREYFQEKAD